MFETRERLFKTPEGKERTRATRKLLNALGLNTKAHMYHIKRLNNRQPYHNYHHMMTVALLVDEAARFYGLETKQTRLLVLAALYHDVAHSGSSRSLDIRNIGLALGYTEPILRSSESWMTDDDIAQVCRLILVTESSHMFTAENISEEIIQDADLLQNVVADNIVWFEALSAETKLDITLESSKEFLRSKKLHTLWADKRVEAFIA